MRFKLNPLLLAALPTLVSAPAYAVQYLTIAQAQKIIFPGASNFESNNLSFSDEENKFAQQRSQLRSVRRFLKCWVVRSPQQNLGYFIVDEVIGKHEEIDYALGVSADGKIVGVEILEYRETHGSQIKEPGWRAQFVGKSINDTLKIGRDIQNISGATLSSLHLTEGIRGILALLEVKHGAR